MRYICDKNSRCSYYLVFRLHVHVHEVGWKYTIFLYLCRIFKQFKQYLLNWIEIVFTCISQCINFAFFLQGTFVGLFKRFNSIAVKILIAFMPIDIRHWMQENVTAISLLNSKKRITNVLKIHCLCLHLPIKDGTFKEKAGFSII